MSGLSDIPSGGCLRRPKFLLVFINPTARNISSNPAWKGPRFPFVGTTKVWQVLSNAGFLPEEFSRLKKEDWTEGFSREVEEVLKKRGIALTNVCKKTKPDGKNPEKKELLEGAEALRKEVLEIAPETIVAMGIIPFEAVSGRKIKLSESAGKELFLEIGGRLFRTVPCYFPVGRGNPKKAEKILSNILRRRKNRSPGRRD